MSARTATKRTATATVWTRLNNALGRLFGRTGCEPSGDPRKERGRKGEALAAKYLKRKGFRILAANYTNRLGEIDILAADGPVLVFVEVKTRTSEAFGPAKAAVTPAKQRKISQVALACMKEPGHAGKKARFDVVAVTLGPGKPTIEHIPNAFELAYP